MDAEPFNKLISTAREMMGSAVPPHVQATLEAWANRLISEGVAPEDLHKILRGESTITVSSGVQLAEATGSAKLLKGTVEAISEAAASGAIDDVLGELRAYERQNANRKGVLKALSRRVDEHALEDQADHPLAALEHELAQGLLDDQLDTLLALEHERKGRKGAIALYEARLALRVHLDVLDGTVQDLQAWLEAHEDAPKGALREAEQAGKNRASALRLLEA